MVWNGMLPMEVKDLKRHCDKREQIAFRMREQFQAETLVCIHSFSFQMAFVYFFHVIQMLLMKLHQIRSEIFILIFLISKDL